jgi:hypothetical protein
MTNAISGSGTSASPWLVSGTNAVCNFSLTVNGSGTPKPVYWGMWYDADGNGSFIDTADVFMSGNLMHGSPVSTTVSFTVPMGNGAINGAIRLIGTAVDSSFTKEMNGTGSFTNGEVEDYFITYATPLPITLKSFTGFPAGKCAASLEWATSSEHNSESFEIQRSSNGRDFQLIGKIKSNNNATGSKYTFVDNNALDGSNYYRLVMVDIDGRSQYSNTIVVNTECNNVNIKLLPNPVTSIATVTGLKAGDKIQVISSDGRIEMERIAGANTADLDMSSLPYGVHLVQVLRNGFAISHIKVTKM